MTELDILDRLRSDIDYDCKDDAADEIEQLRTQLRILRAALEEIADDPTGESMYQADLAKQALGGTYEPYEPAKQLVTKFGEAHFELQEARRNLKAAEQRLETIRRVLVGHQPQAEPLK